VAHFVYDGPCFFIFYFLRLRDTEKDIFYTIIISNTFGAII